MFVRNFEYSSYNPNCLIVVIKVGGRGDGGVSYFGKICNPFQFAMFVFYMGLTKKDLVSFVNYHTSRIAKTASRL